MSFFGKENGFNKENEDWAAAGARSARALIKRFMSVEDPCKVAYEDYWKQVKDHHLKQLKKKFPDWNDSQLVSELAQRKTYVFDSFVDGWLSAAAEAKKSISTPI
jgi:hypothetical protein